MWGRAWVSVLFIATLTGCASRVRSKSFLPNLSLAVECASSIRLESACPCVRTLVPQAARDGLSSATDKLGFSVGVPMAPNWAGEHV